MATLTLSTALITCEHLVGLITSSRDLGRWTTIHGPPTPYFGRLRLPGEKQSAPSGATGISRLVAEHGSPCKATQVTRYAILLSGKSR